MPLSRPIWTSPFAATDGWARRRLKTDLDAGDLPTQLAMSERTLLFHRVVGTQPAAHRSKFCAA
ncbi:MAG TPA: hypothetical protein VJQ06_11080 [Rhizomicrobium sp.]|nr:hypothetical protein [Rhizomicrobium sp.]